MKKNLLLRLCLMMSVVLALSSCISDDLSSQENSTQDASSFQIFNNRNSQYAQRGSSGSLYYQEAFRDLYFSYYRNNPEGAPDFSDFKKPYVDFRFASQVLYSEDSTRYVLFPFIEDAKVKYVMACSVNSKHDKVAFYFPEKSEIVQNAIASFSIAIEGKGTPGFDMDNPAPIEEVIITTPPKAHFTLTPFEPNFNYPMPPSGGCGTYNNCGGGGSSSPPITPPPATPCDKLKAQNADTRFKEKVKALDKPEVLNQTKENGFAEAYGPQTNYEPLNNISHDALNMPIGNKYFGYMHTHHNKEGAVKIFSPADIFTFLSRCVRNAQLNGTMADAYAMVITSQGNYMLKYSGDGSYGLGPSQLASWQTWYQREYGDLNENGELTQPNVEKLFTKFLQEKVKINGLEIYKSDKTTGNSEKLSYNGKDNPVQSVPCP